MKERMRGVTVLAVVCLLKVASAFDIDMPLEHSLDGGKTFSQAGTLQGFLGPAHRELLTLLREDLTPAEQEQLKYLVQHNKDYKLRLGTNPSDQSSPTILTSVPARCLFDRNQLLDRIVIHATPHGYFTSFNHNFAHYPCKLSEDQAALPADLNFPESSDVEVWKPVVAPILTKSEGKSIDGAKSSKSKAKRRAGTEGKEGEGDDAPEEDNRPWIVKNWMIAVPIGLVAFNILTAVAAPAEQAGQGRGPPAARTR